MSLVDRCPGCEELITRCVCGLTTEEAKEARRKRAAFPSRAAQREAFIRRGPDLAD